MPTIHSILGSAADAVLFVILALSLKGKRIKLGTIQIIAFISLLNAVVYGSGMLVKQSVAMVSVLISFAYASREKGLENGEILPTFIKASFLWYFIQAAVVFVIFLIGIDVFDIYPYHVYPMFSILAVIVYVFYKIMERRKGGMK